MPIEIKELQIRGVVNPSVEPSLHPLLREDDLENLKQEIIRECMERILQKLQEQNER